MTEPIVITGRYCGPSESGNGGYTCGRLASVLSGTVEVTLRRPPPLDRRLDVLRQPAGIALVDGESVVAEARLAELDLEAPVSPGLGAAADASSRYRGLSEHAFPHCFVCGPQRDIGDGLRIFPGEVDHEGMVAAPWTPQAWLGDASATVRREFVWAALDCPGAWAWLGDQAATLVLGRLTVAIDAPARAGRPHVVAGWRMGQDGRKHYAGTALYRADGTVCARGKATWIEVDRARFGG